MTQTAVERRLARLADTSNRRAIRLRIPGRISSVDLLMAFQRAWDDEAEAFLCPYCGVVILPDSCSFDHVRSMTRGGVNDISNIVACCLSCQRSKATDKNPAELAEWHALRVTCPVDGKVFRPRWADWKRGLGKVCSRRCAGTIGGRA